MSGSTSLAAQKLLQERQVEIAKKKFIEQALIAPLSGPQKAFVLDPAENKIAVTSRQSGKTFSALTILLLRVLQPHQLCAYVHPTRQQARDVLWLNLQRKCQELGLQADFNEQALEARFPNGSIIYLKGVPDITRADRFRGLTLDLLVIDEAATYSDELLKYLLEDSADATTLVNEAPIILLSTPGLQPRGYFYELTLNQAWAQHHWTIHANPRVKDPESRLEKIRLKHGWQPTEPTFLREYRGIWAEDTNAQVYRVSASNLYQDLPQGEWQTVLGVDLGSEDSNAFTVLGWLPHSNILYVLHSEASERGARNDVTDTAERIKALHAQYNPTAIVVDAGGLGRMIVDEMANRHGLPVEATPKSPGYKPAIIRQINADLNRKKILLPKGALYDQMQRLQWHPDSIGLKEHPSQPNDLADSAIYAYIRCQHYLEQEATQEASVNSPEYFRQKSERIKQALGKTNQKDPYAQPSWQNEISIDEDF